jgi:hypothetical protein
MKLTLLASLFLISSIACNGSLLFLSDSNESLAKITPEEGTKIILGFFKGIGLFDESTHSCKPKDFEDLFEPITIMKEILLNATQEEYMEQMMVVQQAFADILIKFAQIAMTGNDCMKYVDEIIHISQRFYYYTHEDSYTQKTFENVLMNFVIIRNHVTDANVKIGEKKFKKAGQSLGKAFKVAFLLDFKP